MYRIILHKSEIFVVVCQFCLVVDRRILNFHPVFHRFKPVEIWGILAEISEKSRWQINRILTITRLLIWSSLWDHFLGIFSLLKYFQIKRKMCFYAAEPHVQKLLRHKNVHTNGILPQLECSSNSLNSQHDWCVQNGQILVPPPAQRVSSLPPPPRPPSQRFGPVTTPQKSQPSQIIETPKTPQKLNVSQL